jgi:hypothetical protein
LKALSTLKSFNNDVTLGLYLLPGLSFDRPIVAIALFDAEDKIHKNVFFDVLLATATRLALSNLDFVTSMSNLKGCPPRDVSNHVVLTTDAHTRSPTILFQLSWSFPIGA